PESFAVPHTYWSMVTSTFFGGGTAPAKTTFPLMPAAALWVGAHKSASRSAAIPAANLILFIYISIAHSAGRLSFERSSGCGSGQQGRGSQHTLLLGQISGRCNRFDSARIGDYWRPHGDQSLS